MRASFLVFSINRFPHFEEHTMGFDLGSLLSQFTGGAQPANTANAQDHFDQVAQQAPAGMVSDGLAAMFRSDQTPPFGQMAGQLFGQSNPNQQAGMLNQLIAGLGPGVLGSLLGGAGGGGLGAILSKLTGGSNATQAPTITPEQASQLSPAQVQDIANHAEKQNPGVIDQLSSFYAQHPQLVKSVGGAALAIALGRMAQSHRG
jgi:hypothetical protein